MLRLSRGHGGPPAADRLAPGVAFKCPHVQNSCCRLLPSPKEEAWEQGLGNMAVPEGTGDSGLRLRSVKAGRFPAPSGGSRLLPLPASPESPGVCSLHLLSSLGLCTGGLRCLAPLCPATLLLHFQFKHDLPLEDFPASSPLETARGKHV